MNRIRKKTVFGMIYSVLLTVFTVYAALDTFVIPRVYASAPPAVTVSETVSGETVSGETVSTETVSSETVSAETVSSETVSGETVSAETLSSETVSSETVYSDSRFTITLSTVRAYDTDIYVADITLSSPEYLKTALAQNAYGQNVTAATSAIARENSAILAINGDFYGAQRQGYVLKNGVVYRDTPVAGKEDLVVWSDGSFEIIREDEVSAQELADRGAVQLLSFGPALVKDGAIAVTQGQEVGKAMASNPRTALGQIGPLHYVFVVSDGRTQQSEGLSLSELADFMQGLGVQTAYNLDGGGSSVMYFNGRVVNNPTTNGRTIKERSVSDIVFIS